MIPSSVRIWVCTAPVDMRKGFDRLALIARERCEVELEGGVAVVVFTNKRATRLKLIWCDATGCCVLYKRAHRVRFRLPGWGGSASTVVIDLHQVGRLIAGEACSEKNRRVVTH